MKIDSVGLTPYQTTHPSWSRATTNHVEENSANPNTVSATSSQNTHLTEVANNSLADFDGQISKIENQLQKYADNTQTAEMRKDALFREAMSIVEKTRAQRVEKPLRDDNRQEIARVLDSTINGIQKQRNLREILSGRSPEAFNIVIDP
jgi:hypothetical protein